MLSPQEVELRVLMGRLEADDYQEPGTFRQLFSFVKVREHSPLLPSL